MIFVIVSIYTTHYDISKSIYLTKIRDILGTKSISHIENLGYFHYSVNDICS